MRRAGRMIDRRIDGEVDPRYPLGEDLKPRVEQAIDGRGSVERFESPVMHPRAPAVELGGVAVRDIGQQAVKRFGIGCIAEGLVHSLVAHKA